MIKSTGEMLFEIQEYALEYFQQNNEQKSFYIVIDGVPLLSPIDP